MATTRRLTIASMAAPGWVKINEVSNLSMTYSVLCGGQIKISRSSDGKVFSWETNTDHIRIYVDMEGPTDLPFITYASSGAGWFNLDGFGQISLGQSRALVHGKPVADVEELSKLEIGSFEGVNKAAAA